MNRYKGPAKTGILFAMVLFSSCGFGWKPAGGTTNKFKYLYDLQLAGHAMTISLSRHAGLDSSSVFLHLMIHGNKDTGLLHITRLRIDVNANTAGGQPYRLKSLRYAKYGDRGAGQWVVVTDTAVKDLDLGHGDYLFDYVFLVPTKIASRRKVSVQLEGEMGSSGKTTSISRSVLFKRYFWVDIAGN